MTATIVILGTFLSLFAIISIVFVILYVWTPTWKETTTPADLHWTLPEVKAGETIGSNFELAPTQYPEGLLEYGGIVYHGIFMLTGGLGDIVRTLFACGVGLVLLKAPTDRPFLIFLATHNSTETMAEIASLFPTHHAFHAIPYTDEPLGPFPSLQHLVPMARAFEQRMNQVYTLLYKNPDNWDRRQAMFGYYRPDRIPEFAHFGKKIAVLQRCAGTRERDIPLDLARSLTKRLIALGFLVVHIGKHFQRGFVPHWSPALGNTTTTMATPDLLEKWDLPLFDETVENYTYKVDKLSFIETHAIVANAATVVTAHTATLLLAMEFNRPTLCVGVGLKTEGIFTDPKLDFWGGYEFTQAPETFKYYLPNSTYTVPQSKSHVLHSTNLFSHFPPSTTTI